MDKKPPFADEITVYEQLSVAIEENNTSYIQKTITNLVPEEIAEVLEASPQKERLQLWLHIKPNIQGCVLVHTNEEVRSYLLEQLNKHQIAELIKNLDTDDITDIAQSITSTERQHLLSSLTKQNRQAVETALSYPEDTAGGLMSADFINIRSNVSLGAVLRLLKKIAPIPTSTTDLFVSNRQGIYQGILPITKLITHDPQTLVSTIMETRPAINATIHETKVSHIFEKNDLISTAVIDDNNLILGRITIDDVVDIIREESERTQMLSAGLNEEDDLFAPPLKSTQRRTFWLGLNLLTAFFASTIISIFEATIQEIVALAILMPIVASMGGVAGTQTAIIVIRALATGKLCFQNRRQLLIKEAMVGLLNGILWASVTGIAISIIFSDISLGLIFAAAMLINLIIAALAGALIPIFLNKINVDPALAAGLMITTLTDTIGFFVFLGLATIVLL